MKWKFGIYDLGFTKTERLYFNRKVRHVFSDARKGNLDNVLISELDL
jgi:hypothetical protein